MFIRIKKMPSAYIEAVEVWLLQRMDRIWELLYSLQFGSKVPVSNLDVSGMSAQHAVAYQPVSVFRLRLLLNALFEYEYHRKSKSFSQFIDVGCGRGKLAIYAKKILQSIQVCGFDFSADLVQSAKENAKKANINDIEFFVADAADYIISGDRAIIALFNPFDETMLRTFLTNNIDFILRTQSVLLYIYDYHRNVPSEFGLKIIYRTQRAWGSVWSCSIR